MLSYDLNSNKITVLTKFAINNEFDLIFILESILNLFLYAITNNNYVLLDESKQIYININA
jgi:hypothetical protein